jgi:CubicO group peptidase (beta-lactamase class C family)
MRRGVVLAKEVAGDAIVGERKFTVRSPFRAASISKLATALTALKLHEDKTLNLDRPVNEALGFSSSEARVTLRQLLSHTSGLSDPDIYWLAHPKNIRDLSGWDLTRRKQPPHGFEYCNLNYGLAATVLESITQRRFDRLSHDFVLKPHALDAGFNWSNVSTPKRQKGAALYRETERGWKVQTDGPEVLRKNEPTLLMEYGEDLSTYAPGQNGTLFSPQGGLRASLLDLATIAAQLKYASELTKPIWPLNDAESNGVHDQRYFTQFGTGVHIHPAEESPWAGQTMWGHHGEAYGLYAGAWYLPDLDISLSYCVTGTPETPPARSKAHPALNTFTEPLLRAAVLAYQNRSG